MKMRPRLLAIFLISLAGGAYLAPPALAQDTPPKLTIPFNPLTKLYMDRVVAQDASGDVVREYIKETVTYRGHTLTATQQRLVDESMAAISMLDKTTSADPLYQAEVEQKNASARQAAESKLIQLINTAESEYQAELKQRKDADVPKVLCNESLQKCFTPAVATSIFAVVTNMNKIWPKFRLSTNPKQTVVDAVLSRRTAVFMFNKVLASQMNGDLKDEILHLIKLWHEEVERWTDGYAANRMYERVYVSERTGRFGSASWDQVADAFRQLQGEIAKKTQAYRLIEEALAAYKIQEVLRTEAVKIGETLKSSEAACMNTAQADQATQIQGNARVFATQITEQRLASSLNDLRNTARYITDRYVRSNSLYCTPRDAANGLCKKTDMPAGDINAALMFSSDPTDEGIVETYQNEKRVAAVQDFSERITGARFFAEVLPMHCETEPCRAYEELRRKAKSLETIARGSYNYIIGRRVSTEDMAKILPNKSAISAGVKEKHAF